MGQSSTIFFPLYAGLTDGLGRLLGGNYILAGLAVSTLAIALALLLLIQLGADLFGTSSGRLAAVAPAVYPTAVFLIAPFTQSLFLALTLGTFLAAYRARWILTAILAFLASLTGGPGMAAASFAVLGWLQGKQGLPSGRRPSLLALGAAVLAPLAGGAAFLEWRSFAGFSVLLDVSHARGGTSVADPGRGVSLAIGQWIYVHGRPTTADLVPAFAFLGIRVMAAHARW